MLIERARTTQSRATFPRRRKSCIYALADYTSLEFCDRGQHVHLQATGWIAFARVDPLRRGD
jgi:hypothetical protein